MSIDNEVTSDEVPSREEDKDKEEVQQKVHTQRHDGGDSTSDEHEEDEEFVLDSERAGIHHGSRGYQRRDKLAHVKHTAKKKRPPSRKRKNPLKNRPQSQSSDDIEYVSFKLLLPYHVTYD